MLGISPFCIQIRCSVGTDTGLDRSTESIIVAKYYANKHGYGVSPNRELVAMGMANIIGSFFRFEGHQAPSLQ